MRQPLVLLWCPLSAVRYSADKYRMVTVTTNVSKNRYEEYMSSDLFHDFLGSVYYCESKVVNQAGIEQLENYV
jgi:hypothetical protein